MLSKINEDGSIIEHFSWPRSDLHAGINKGRIIVVKINTWPHTAQYRPSASLTHRVGSSTSIYGQSERNRHHIADIGVSGKPHVLSHDHAQHLHWGKKEVEKCVYIWYRRHGLRRSMNSNAEYKLRYKPKADCVNVCATVSVWLSICVAVCSSICLCMYSCA